MSRHDALPLLPANAVLEYLAEGAANVVYRLSIPQVSPSPLSPSLSSLSDDPLLHGNARDEHVLAVDSAPVKPAVVVVAPESGGQHEAAASTAAAATAFKGRLLRLRKALPSTVSNERSYQNFHEIIRPLFPTTDYLVRPELVRVPAGVLAQCNARLREAEAVGESDDDAHANGQHTDGGKANGVANGGTNGGTISGRVGGGSDDEGRGSSSNSSSSDSRGIRRFRRPAKRHGVYLAEDEPYGVLVTDMTADARKGELSLEFKPKWLAQSPSAPAAAMRCRTCALRAKKNAAAAAERRRRQPHHNAAEASFCPLDLVSDDRRRVEAAVRCILAANAAALREPHEAEQQQQQKKKRREEEKQESHGQQPPLSPSSSSVPCLSLQQLEGELSRFLYRHPLLRRLRQLQTELDPYGVLALEALPAAARPAAYADFLIAMTLRDCTVFLKIRPPDHGVEDHPTHHHHHQQHHHRRRQDQPSTSSPPLPPSTAAFTRAPRTPSLSSPSSAAVSSSPSLQPSPPPPPPPRIEICLGDLDLKAPNGGKAGYWRALEAELIGGGWYTGEEEEEDSAAEGEGDGQGREGEGGSKNGVRKDIHCNITATT